MITPTILIKKDFKRIKYKTVNYSVLFAVANEGQEYIGFMILLGAIGKSAQIGLHT